ncbi:hypothetical protein CALCODRAFT_143623 [Calocera cornea HHB12733]|uniref:Ricin B lectin domain-containing protein n=1 Tax=Calocera cornea HHB12733 TaxID=1353952 RepID=A0A165I7H0_9BASI|nr:hypothetical protein CALCODRAFT_143623 [Calocera cornea HHB12733]
MSGPLKDGETIGPQTEGIKGTHVIINVKSGKALTQLDKDGVSYVVGQARKLGTANASQQWTVEYNTSARAFTFKNIKSGRLMTSDQLASAYAGDAYGVFVQPGTETSGTYWTVGESLWNGSYTITAKDFNTQVLELYNCGDTSDPNTVVNIATESSSSTDKQLWVFAAVGTRV